MDLIFEDCGHKTTVFEVLPTFTHIPNLKGKGWKQESEDNAEQLMKHWMESQPAPDTVLNLLASYC